MLNMNHSENRLHLDMVYNGEADEKLPLPHCQSESGHLLESYSLVIDIFLFPCLDIV